MAPHLDVRGARGDQPNGQRALPQVVVEHRNRLVQAPIAVAIRHELVGEVAEVLLVDAVVGIQVRHDHMLGIEA